MRIVSFGVMQTAKLSGVLNLVVAEIVCIPAALSGAFLGLARDHTKLLVGSLALPFLAIAYAFAAFLFTALCCLIFNFFSPKLGGIELDVQ
jgi:hypothetical protein